MRRWAFLLLALASCKPGMPEFGKGNECIQRRDYAGARAHFEKCLSQNADFSEAAACLGMSKIWLAKQCVEANRDDEGVSLWRSGIEDLRRAKSLMDQGRFVALQEAGERNRMRDRVAEMLKDTDSPLLLNVKVVVLKIQLTPWPE